jgi:hypothetical protein
MSVDQIRRSAVTDVTEQRERGQTIEAKKPWLKLDKGPDHSRPFRCSARRRSFAREDR